MIVYNRNSNQLKALKEIPFKLEKELQKVFEANLTKLTQLVLVKSEFTIKNYRIDTLAFDEEAKAFVVIEYKRNISNSVVDQGIAYLNLMLDYKAEFIIEYNEYFKKSLLRSEVDWSQTKVLFVSPNFNENQKQATNFKDLAIELWEVKQFEKDIIIVNPIKKSKSAPSITQLQTAKDTELKKVVNEIKVFTEDDHLLNKSDKAKELYETLRNSILNLSNQFELDVKKSYIAFKVGRNIIDIEIQSSSLKVWINLKKGQLNDPLNIMRDVSTLKGHNGNGDYEIIFKDTEHLEYFLTLVKQALKKD